MSTPSAPTSRSSASAHPTRQQLDELDALLQRMLDLPVNQVEEGAGEEAPAPPPRPARPAQPPVSYRAPEPPPAPRVVSAPAPRPPEGGRALPSYPASYMVVETVAPRLIQAPPEAEPEPTPAPAETADLEPHVVESQRHPEAPAEDPPAQDQWVPLRSSWRPSPQTWQPLAESWQQARPTPPPPPEPEPAPQESALSAPPIREEAPTALAPADGWRLPGALGQPAAEDTPSWEPPAQTAWPASRPEPVSEPAPPEAVAPPAPEPRPKPGRAAPWHLMPLVWFNRAFDGCLESLGAPGRWLCGPAGRNVLGGVGLLGLAAAAALAAAARIGWTW